MTDGPLRRLLDDIAVNLAAWIAPHLPPRQPLPVRVRFLRERVNAMGQNVLVFAPDLPAPGDTDVVERVLSVTIGGVTTTHDVSSGPGEFEVPEGESATLSVRERDQKGRWGDASDPFTFTAIDEYQPAKPGQVGIRFVREYVKEDAGEDAGDDAASPVADSVTADDDDGEDPPAPADTLESLIPDEPDADDDSADPDDV